MNNHEQPQTTTNQNRPKLAVWLTPLFIFILALLPRAYDLPRFVTADEAKWVYRSAQFLAALLAGDFANTNVNLTPGVTTTWLGRLGLGLYYQWHQAEIGLPLRAWLLTLPEFRAELDLLVALRWPLVCVDALGVVVIYGLSRRLLTPPVAFIGGIFLALAPHPIALSRVLGHDAPAALAMTIALLSLLVALYTYNYNESEAQTSFWQGGKIWLILSAIATGLACLSKAPALFLLPFGSLLIGSEWLRRPSLAMLSRLAIWLLGAYLTFILVWPAAWVAPLGAPYAIIENAFLSATDSVEAAAEGYWRVPNLGLFYYFVHGGFKLSPLVLLGLGLAMVGLWWRRAENQHILWLLIFCLLFTLFMTLGDKRSPRYLLPIFPSLTLIGAWGWYTLLTRYLPDLTTPLRLSFYALLTVSAAVLILPLAPYYFSYYNPLLGGSLTAPRLVKIGWGEGLDQVGRFLQRTAPDARVGTAYASTVAPYFDGDLASVTSDHLDRIVLYTKQTQSGEPSPDFIDYFDAHGALFTVEINNIEYAHVYAGPTLQMLPANELGISGFRPLTPYARLGEPLQLDLLWSAASLPAELVVTLHAEQTVQATESQPATRVESRLTRHTLNLPPDLPRGEYTVQVNGESLGQIEARLFEPPANLSTERILFGEQIALVGYQLSPEAQHVSLTVAWQAEKSRLPNYTVFAQLINLETNERAAGVDSQPQAGSWPTSRWVRGEVVIDHLRIDLSADFADGAYKLIIGLYTPNTGERLQLPSGHDHWALPLTLLR